MSKTEKLLEKLKRGAINALELKTLLRHLGWILDRTKGSHEVWVNDSKLFVLATHSKELKPYQLKQAKTLLLVEEEDEKNKSGQQDGN